MKEILLIVVLMFAIYLPGMCIVDKNVESKAWIFFWGWNLCQIYNVLFKILN
jgi:hypothetical protein